MDFGFSPSQSPRQSNAYTGGQYFDSTSDSSSPDSPQNMSQLLYNGGSMQYDSMFNYGTTPATYYPTSSNKISVEYTGSSTLDERDRRRRRSGSTSTSSLNSKDKDSLTNMHLRRRAQNRASQRAFRERKEKHVKGLEHQLEDLHEKHQDLLQSYSRQADEVSRLNARISQLTAELGSLRTGHSDQPFSEMLMPDKFDKFDAFAAHDMLYNGPESYFDKSAADLNSEFALHSFEDSL
jgi:AP-1-like factor